MSDLPAISITVVPLPNGGWSVQLRPAGPALPENASAKDMELARACYHILREQVSFQVTRAFAA
ncbi:MAG: hypothetical protein P0120_16850 [Nitrospira sp.]|nr:hypothetical protein [Nitrospira sp.]